MGKEEPELLVEGTKQKEGDTADHGDRPKPLTATPERVATPVLMHDGVPVVCDAAGQEPSGAEGLGATPAALVHQSIGIDADVPLQVQSEPLPPPAPAKKSRTSWLTRKST